MKAELEMTICSVYLSKLLANVNKISLSRQN